MEFLVKLANFKMAVSMKPFNWFWCFNFWEKALDVYLNSGMTAGPPDPYNQRNTAASFGQHCMWLWSLTFNIDFVLFPDRSQGVRMRGLNTWRKFKNTKDPCVRRKIKHVPLSSNTKKPSKTWQAACMRQSKNTLTFYFPCINGIYLYMDV